ncbi:MAG: hypothetical protein IPO21_13725 [Bacteroidales bacterium]|nr:hypothetical protein [Bacteroidales bacterium]
MLPAIPFNIVSNAPTKELLHLPSHHKNSSRKTFIKEVKSFNPSSSRSIPNISSGSSSTTSVNIGINTCLEAAVTPSRAAAAVEYCNKEKFACHYYNFIKGFVTLLPSLKLQIT